MRRQCRRDTYVQRYNPKTAHARGGCGGSATITIVLYHLPHHVSFAHPKKICMCKDGHVIDTNIGDVRQTGLVVMGPNLAVCVCLLSTRCKINVSQGPLLLRDQYNRCTMTMHAKIVWACGITTYTLPPQVCEIPCFVGACSRPRGSSCPLPGQQESGNGLNGRRLHKSSKYWEHTCITMPTSTAHTVRARPRINKEHRANKISVIRVAT